MIKSKLMHQYKSKFGGEYQKENGRWFWVKGKEKTLVTSGWLVRELAKPAPKPEPKSTPKKAKVVFGEPKVPEVVKEEVPPVVTQEVVNETPTIKWPHDHDHMENGNETPITE